MKQLFVIALLSTQLCAFAQKERAYQVSFEDKDTATMLLRRATSKLDNGLSKESYPLIFKAISVDSTAHRSYELLYRASLTDENYSDSIIHYFAQGKQIFGLDDELCFYIAELYRYRKDYKKAILEYSKAIELSKGFEVKSQQYIQYFAGRAYSYIKLTKLDEAISDYSEFLKSRPDDAIMLTNRGVCYQKKGNVELAIADWKKSAALGNLTAKTYLKNITKK